jgi:hypothetical protein
MQSNEITRGWGGVTRAIQGHRKSKRSIERNSGSGTSGEEVVGPIHPLTIPERVREVWILTVGKMAQGVRESQRERE